MANISIPYDGMRHHKKLDATRGLRFTYRDALGVLVLYVVQAYSAAGP